MVVTLQLINIADKNAMIWNADYSERSRNRPQSCIYLDGLIFLHRRRRDKKYTMNYLVHTVAIKSDT